MVFQDVVFWSLSVASVLAALGVVLLRDIFRSALLLVGVFLGVAGLFVLMNAEFLAVVQVLIYAGAVAVLIIFAITLTREVQQGNLPNPLQPPAVLFPALLLAALVFVAVDTDWELVAHQPDEIQRRVELVQTNSIGGVPDEMRDEVPGSEGSGLGELLTNDFALPFEVASVVLLAAVVGALVLVRQR